MLLTIPDILVPSRLEGVSEQLLRALSVVCLFQFQIFLVPGSVTVCKQLCMLYALTIPDILVSSPLVAACRQLLRALSVVFIPDILVPVLML